MYMKTASALDVCFYVIFDVTVILNGFSVGSPLNERTLGQSERNNKNREQLTIIEPSLSGNNVDNTVDNMTLSTITTDDSVQIKRRGVRNNVNSTRIGLHEAIRRNMIRGGSKMAIYIPKLTYLKKEMCKSEPLQQIIKEPGCLPTSVINRLCYGQCNSFFIPKSGKSRPKLGESTLESSAFRSCSFCRPKHVDWISVQLMCPKKNPAFKVKRIQIVKECSCIALKLD